MAAKRVLNQPEEVAGLKVTDTGLGRKHWSGGGVEAGGSGVPHSENCLGHCALAILSEWQDPRLRLAGGGNATWPSTPAIRRQEITSEQSRMESPSPPPSQLPLS